MGNYNFKTIGRNPLVDRQKLKQKQSKLLACADLTTSQLDLNTTKTNTGMSLQSSGFSLVKYDTPILVSKTFGKGAATSSNTSAKTSASSLASGNEANKAEDYLNSILPPREYSDAGQLWVQYVSPIPATRLDVIILQEELDKKLQERQARETGIR